MTDGSSRGGPPRDMWSDACELLERAERIRRAFFVPGRGRTDGPVWEPPADVYETARELCVVVALPGVAAADVEIALRRDVLVVAGRRTLPAGLRRATLHRLEIPYGRFERRLRLAGPELSLGATRFADGCLELVLEKRA